ncbi:MAG: type IX secretion system membrane protein PorP/SprF [Chitinophagales bacterium]|nr:type IX secretion system membrane protein PorP/SprF [Chitinophagales bacterium]
MTKQPYLILTFLLFAGGVSAQQEQMYTQFMFNKLTFNPAYAGNFVSPTLTTIYRNQWMGMDGAPKSMALSYTQPLLNNRVGIGGNISRQSIGINTNLTFDIAYAYRIQMKRGILAVGLQASMRNFRQNWADSRIIPIDQGDPGIPLDPKSKFVPNFGAGVYYNAYTNKWYAGLALPRIVNNSIDFAEFGETLSREVQHFNAMGGIQLEATEDLKVTPQVLIRYALGAPVDAEVNVSALLRNKFYGGLTYRLGGDINFAGESIDVAVGIQAIDELFFCFSYDIGLTRLRRHHNGSIEATVRWYINPPDDVVAVKPARPF